MEENIVESVISVIKCVMMTLVLRSFGPKWVIKVQVKLSTRFFDKNFGWTTFANKFKKLLNIAA
jgi:hypothetical protein